jgi:hypothetical protein
MRKMTPEERIEECNEVYRSNCAACYLLLTCVFIVGVALGALGTFAIYRWVM